MIPITRCTCVRSYFKLSLIKFKLRSTMNQGRLNALMILTVEHEMSVNVDANAVDNFKLAVDFKR